MGTLRPINPHTASLIVNPQAAAHDYDNLTHKPQINGHELSGDQSGSDLGLQNQLTAGDNVTIDENGVISAEGGTDDYNDLENKPQFVVANAPDGWGINIPVQGVIELMTFYLQSDQNNRKVLRIKDNAIVFSMLSSALQKEMFKDYGIAREIPTDFFTNSSSAPSTNGLWLINKTDLSGMPIPAAGYLFNFICGVNKIQFYLTDYYNDLDEQFRLFFRTQYMGGFNKWVELTGGGSQIASAAVNKDGTITFTMSDGSTVTTTGESVIGPQGPAGADGNDYVLTNQDKSDIADLVLAQLPTTQGVLYGNTSN